MPSSRYALVTYIRNPVGEFVEQLRRELHPTTAHMAAHLSILPPRELTGSEAAALEFLEDACSRVVPFSVDLGDVETFLPVTPTVFIEVKQAAYRMRELHDQLCGRGLRCQESWPYIPHLTILKTERDEQARAAYDQLSKDYPDRCEVEESRGQHDWHNRQLGVWEIDTGRPHRLRQRAAALSAHVLG